MGLMTHRKPGTVVAVWLLTFFLSVPFGYFVFQVGSSVLWSVRRGSPLLPSVPGFAQQQISYSEFSYARLWQDQFVIVRPDHKKIMAQPAINGLRTVMDWKVSLVDPESGESKDTPWELNGNGYSTEIIGDRLLFSSGKQQFEVIGNVLQPADFPSRNDSLIVLDHEIARIRWHAPLEKFYVSRQTSEGWVDESFVVLPTDKRAPPQRIAVAEPKLECLYRGDVIFAFLKTGGQLYFHEGLPCQKIDRQGQPIPFEKNESKSAEVDQASTGWSVVRNEDVNANWTDHQYGTLFEEKPAALIVDQGSAGYSIGHFYKFNGHEWSEIASLPFPFGSTEFRVLTRSGSQSPFIVATTSTGTAFAYVVEPPGFRRIERTGPAETWKHVCRNLLIHLSSPVIVVFLSMLPALGIWLLLARFKDAHYEFGIQTVQLASLGRRGLARLIDLAWMILLPLAVGLIGRHDFDWLSLAEAIKLKIDHPTLHSVHQILITLVILVFVELVFLVAIQGFRGITPGKWLCGLRTRRTTLRSCGFARSLLRELMLVAETLQLTCWLPPVLSIGLTPLRQRLGDFVSDTIVIEATSESRDRQ